MTIRTRILDILPALLAFTLVTLFASYVLVAFIMHDPLWLATLAQHAQEVRALQGMPGHDIAHHGASHHVTGSLARGR